MRALFLLALACSGAEVKPPVYGLPGASSDARPCDKEALVRSGGDALTGVLEALAERHGLRFGEPRLVGARRADTLCSLLYSVPVVGDSSYGAALVQLVFADGRPEPYYVLVPSDEP